MQLGSSLFSGVKGSVVSLARVRQKREGSGFYMRDPVISQVCVGASSNFSGGQDQVISEVVDGRSRRWGSRAFSGRGEEFSISYTGAGDLVILFSGGSSDVSGGSRGSCDLLGASEDPVISQAEPRTQ